MVILDVATSVHLSPVLRLLRFERPTGLRQSLALLS
jgi:hypothetical protein